jgi:hypothetical protein
VLVVGLMVVAAAAVELSLDPAGSETWPHTRTAEGGCPYMGIDDVLD